MGVELNAKTQGRKDARDVGGLTSWRPSDLALSEGFRDTPLGPLPETWEVVQLGDVAEFSHRPRNLPSPDAVPFLPMTLIPNQDLYATRWELRSPSEVRSGVFCQEGDLLLAKITPCLENGKQGIVKGIPGGWGIATTEVFPIHSSIVFNEFLALYLKLPEVRRSLAGKMEGTTGRQRLPKAVVESLSVPLPPLPEQRAIAHALRTVQEAREATGRVIAAARELKRSLMRHLFTYGPVPVAQADQVELQETEVGSIPAYWRVARLGEKAQLKNGLNFSREQKGNGVLTVDVLNMYTDSIYPQLGNLYRVDVDPAEGYLLQPGDILLVRSSLKQEGVGWPALFQGHIEPVTFCGFLIRARLTSQDIRSDFLVSYLRLPSVRRLLVSKSGRVAITNINQGGLRTLPVPIPSISEQHEIACTLAAVEAKIAAEEARRGALEALFHTLLHHLMTGKIRTQGRKDAKTQSKT